ncbi:MAG TPA: hypothetical protein VHB97_09125 [Polyangia bacterium]|nr:hypothetical protein [Polyangia bacterium]
MRVTQTYMMERAAAATSNAQSQVATASDEVTSGLRVTQPSDDLVGWEEAQRASIRSSESSQRGTAITLGLDKLQSADSALGDINTTLTTAISLANQMANGTLNATQRASAAQQVQTLHDQVLASANTLGSDGKPVFSGSQSGTPFSSSDVYSGDSVAQTIEVSEGHSQTVGVSGAVLTSANGVNVLGTLTALATALASNDTAGISQSITDLTTAQQQVSSAQADIGSQESALNAANDARSAFETQLTTLQTNAVGADTVTAASALAQAQTGYTAATDVAQLISQMADKNIT